MLNFILFSITYSLLYVWQCPVVILPSVVRQAQFLYTIIFPTLLGIFYSISSFISSKYFNVIYHY